MKKNLIILCLIFCNWLTYSQTESDKEKAHQLGIEAINLMDNGEIDKSIELLEESYKLDPYNTVYPYEIGYAYYMKEDFKKSAEYFKKVIKMDGSNDQCYQMLGNAYDMGGNSKKAIKTYKKGVEMFPLSGRLYLELGNMHLKEVNEAIKYYEKGIEVDPTHSSNYYWATRIYLNSRDEIWGMLYGEMFMNLERGSQRTEEISKLLFDTYQNEIQFISDSSSSVSFCQNEIINLDTKKNVLPFSMVYEPGLLFALIGIDTITLKNLNQIRSNFINFYYKKKFNESHPNIIFDWHKKLMDENMFECYNYWLLMKGAQDEFNSWHNKNQEKFDNFISWFTVNPMQIDEEHYFHRLNY